MHLHVGTSGFAYDSWRGSFYPDDLPERELLGCYARQLNSVEINSTFYRFPTEALLSGWAQQVPRTFRFAIKVPRRITHAKRMQNIDEEMLFLVETVMTLGARLGPLFFQLPPGQTKVLDRCEAVFDLLPPEMRTAFEFRHPSWMDDDVRDLFTARNAAICFNDARMDEPLETGDWGYIRRRRETYGEAELVATANTLAASSWKEAYVFFKHEEAPDTPLVAKRWFHLAGGRTGA